MGASFYTEITVHKTLNRKLKDLYRYLEQGDDYVFDSSSNFGKCLLIHSKILQSIGAVYIEKNGNFHTVLVDDDKKFMVLYKSNIELLYK